MKIKYWQIRGTKLKNVDLSEILEKAAMGATIAFLALFCTLDAGTEQPVPKFTMGKVCEIDDQGLGITINARCISNDQDGCIFEVRKIRKAANRRGD